ncbi:MAG: efflux RND transporter periplasmic adaptor subunit, partial [Planctomycetota bacterium]
RGAGGGEDGQAAAASNGEGGRRGGFSFGFGSEPDPTLVRVGAAETGDLVRVVSAPGSIEPKTLIQISSEVSARIIALPFREGESVNQGDVVVRLEPENLVAALASAEARLLQAEAGLDGAKAELISRRLEYERLIQLLETGDAPESEFEVAESSYLRATSDVKSAEANVAIAEAGIQQAREDLANTTIESPINGVITALNTEVGETAIVGTTNTPGSVIMEIADLSTMLLTAQVDEPNIAPVREGQRATVYINAFPDAEYRGTVERIGLKRQVSTSGTGYFEVEVLLDVTEGTEILRSGLTASTDIQVEPFYDIVRVESQAIVDQRVDELPIALRDNEHVQNDKTFTPVIYRIEDGKAVATPVSIGPSDVTHTVVEGGIESETPYISGPFRVLKQFADGVLKTNAVVKDELEAAREEEARQRGAAGGDDETTEEETTEDGAEDGQAPDEAGGSDDAAGGAEGEERTEEPVESGAGSGGSETGSGSSDG